MAKKSVKKEVVSVATEIVEPSVVVEDVIEKSANVVKSRFTKRFLFSDKEINAMAPMFRDIVLLKKQGSLLPKGPSMMIWKLAVAVKVAQTQPFILRYVGNSGARCKLCGKVIAWSASCFWDDRFYNYETEQMDQKRFVIHAVCKECLEASGAVWLHEAEWLNAIITNRSEAQFHSLGNAKHCQCEICTDHLTESTWVHIPYKHLMLTVAVCEKHFDMLVAHNETHIPLDDSGIVEALVKSHDLAPETLAMMNAFKRVPQKKKTEGASQ